MLCYISAFISSPLLEFQAFSLFSSLNAVVVVFVDCVFRIGERGVFIAVREEWGATFGGGGGGWPLGAVLRTEREYYFSIDIVHDIMSHTLPESKPLDFSLQYRNRGIKAKKISARVSKFTDLIQHVAANCLLHPLSAGRQQPDEISDNDFPPDRPEKLSRSASFREESGDEEEELRWAQLLLLRRRIPVPARDGLRDSLTTASTSIRASTSRRCRCRRLTRRLRCRRSRCSRLVEGLGLVLADWLALCWWRWVASFVIICVRINWGILLKMGFMWKGFDVGWT
ncbi:hypothetical protein RHGRI_007244 [Rhododendron griersonianum]|uniref:Uncharacterized protein n=1 Tax=Rhododendron griersonianum TaxID=479676 RepID=A0AAV6KWW8_9ERIC|nr:hypothetical protein RHGRI_007244 [Rhododendron griersonianum]